MREGFDKLPCLTDKEVGQVHEKSVEILTRTGFRFMHDECIEIFKKHGFKTDKDIVYFTEESINRAIESVGNHFILMAKNPDHNVVFKMDSFSTGMGGSAVKTVLADGRVRPSIRADSVRVMKLAQMLEEVETCRPLLTPSDIDGRHYPAWFTANMVRYMDKPYCHLSSDDSEIVRLAYGVSFDKMQKEAEKGLSYGQSTINVISPLTLGTDECRHMLSFLENGVVFNLAPMPLGGSTAPVTLAGEIILQNCENLAPLVLTQLLKPGRNVLYGTIGSHTDMRSMSSIFGSPESRILECAAARMARHYNMLSRGNVCLTDAAVPDFQAGAESMFQLLNVIRAGINFLPGMGHLGSFMGGSLGKMVLDAELVAYIRRYLQPINFDEDSMAVGLIEKAEPGGQFVTERHTLKHCRTEYIIPKVFQRSSYDAWEKQGCSTAMEVAHKKAEELIGEYQEPYLDLSLARVLETYFE